jgi:hypothetical protein
MEKKKSQYFLLLLLYAFNYFAQSPTIQWQKCYGGSTIDYGYSIIQTSDGGYATVGYTQSNNGDVTGLHTSAGNYPDYWIVRIDNIGNIKWQKCLGGSINDYAYCIRQTLDGGFIVAGTSNSADGNVTGNHLHDDCWVVKLDSLGNIKWEKSYGGSATDVASSILQTSDGGYILAGSTLSNDGDVSGNHGAGDLWIVKLDSIGTISWQKCLGGTNYDNASFAQQTTDGGYIVLGVGGSTDGDITGNHNSADYWLVKLDNLGNLKWEKSFGGTDSDFGIYVQETADHGYIMNGYSYSIDGDVSGNHASAGANDFWVIKTDSLGTIKWEKCFGGSSNDHGSSILQTADGGYIVGGDASSNDGDVSGNHGGEDYWIVKIDAFGSLLWQKCLGGSANDYGRDIALTSDAGIIVTGNTNSNNGDVSGNHGGDDFWVVKLDNVNAINEIKKENDLFVYPNPSTENISIINANVFSFQKSTLTIQNTLGEIVKKLPFTNNIDVSDLAEGCYFIQVTLQNGETLTTKFIKQ